MLDNILIFWEYHNISLDNVSYHGHFLILKYRIPIIVMLKVNVMAVYSLDMNTRVINSMRLSIKQSSLSM